MSEQVILAILGVLATTVGALIWVIKYMFDSLLPVIESLKESVDSNTEQTKANQECLEKRNGSDGRKWEENTAALKQLTASIKKMSAEDV